MTTTPTELLRQALARIERWHGEFPATGKTWDDGTPMSYTACYGSNGERDYMRAIARAALAAIDALPSAPAWPCHCDERGIGKPGVTCGDCPRDYGHTVDSAPSGEPAGYVDSEALKWLAAPGRGPAASVTTKIGKTPIGDEVTPIYCATTAPAPLPAAKPLPVNGIKATMFHDEGAIAQCDHCKRYTLDPRALADSKQPVCDCGKQHYWSGSFIKPGPDAKWHGAAPLLSNGLTEAETSATASVAVPGWPASWRENGWNNCISTAIESLRYLASNARPSSGQSRHNAECLLMTARELETTQRELLAPMAAQAAPAPQAAKASTAAAAPEPVASGYITRVRAQVEEQRRVFPSEEPDYLWRYTHGTRDAEHFEGCADLEVVRLYTHPAPAVAEQTAVPQADAWRKLYRRAINEANGLTNYVEDRPELRRAERNLSAIEAEARTLADTPAPKEQQ